MKSRRRRTVKKARAAAPKKLRFCRKPLRVAANAKAHSLYEMMGLEESPLFSVGPMKKSAKGAPKRPAGKVGDGGWGAILAKLTAKRILADVAKEEKKRAAKDAKHARKRKITYAKRVKEQQKYLALLAKRRSKAVVVKGERAKELALALLGENRIREKYPNLAARLVNAEAFGYKEPDVKVRSIKGVVERFFGWIWHGDTLPSEKTIRVSEDKKHIEFWNYGKNQIEKLSYKDFIESAEEIVQGSRRPGWMPTVAQDKVKFKQKEDKRKKQEKQRAQKAKRPQKAMKWKPLTKEQLREAEEKRLKQEQEWKRAKAIRKSNRVWLDRMTEEVRAKILSETKRTPNLRQIGEVIAAALKKRKPETSIMVYPENDSNSGKATGKLTFGGYGNELEDLIPGAPEPVIKAEKDSEEEEA